MRRWGAAGPPRPPLSRHERARRRSLRLAFALALILCGTSGLIATYFLFLRAPLRDRNWHLGVWAPRPSRTGGPPVPPPGGHRPGRSMFKSLYKRIAGHTRSPMTVLERLASTEDDAEVRRMVRKAARAMGVDYTTKSVVHPIRAQYGHGRQPPLPAPSGDWSEELGVLAAGSDILGSELRRILTVDEAKVACEAHAECEGFTLFGNPAPGEATKVWLKSRADLKPGFTEDGRPWRAYTLRRRAPDHAAARPAVPPHVEPLLQQAQGAVRAIGYDFAQLAREGLAGPLARQWPEYLHGEDNPGFNYPEPREDMLLVSLAPRAYYFPNFLSPAETDGIIEAARPKLLRSQVARGINETKADSELAKVRTSNGAWLNDFVPAVQSARKRMKEVMGLELDSFEPMQVLRYEAGSGQKYEGHWDYFAPSAYGKQDHNRIATFILFLSDVEPGHGGETTLPHAMGMVEIGWNKSRDCSSGLLVRPTKGAALLFYGMRRDHAYDPWSKHAGCPNLGATEKWIAPQWIQRPMPKELPPENRMPGWGI
eukprot:TRINITY_DN11097_c0_g1_i1.p1 TRINITY_DN11097_c0_g1~~TRINITY_DN11097_c0_g1_i1.p1  ORF type:complete len:562 (+),score=164.79 TRINITY_DN11097_c0_g1_i1:69-1688(+)